MLENYVEKSLEICNLYCNVPINFISILLFEVTFISNTFCVLFNFINIDIIWHLEINKLLIEVVFTIKITPALLADLF